MSTPRKNEVTCSRALAYDEDWLDFLEPDLGRDPGSVESLTHLLFTINEALSRGPEGIKAASDALLEGIRVAYLHTDAHKAAVELYLVYLTGNLKPQDEPLQLLNGAIERGRAEIERASALIRKKKHRSSNRKRRLSR